MRIVFGVLVFIVAFFGFFLGGATLVIVGLGEMVSDSERYDVQFGRPGDECDGGTLKINIEDGTALACMVGMPAEPPEFARLPGFTDAQQEEVETLSLELGGRGLSDGEQQQIQDLVDEIAATVPPVEDKIIPGPYGIYRLVLGGAMLATVGISFLVWQRSE